MIREEEEIDAENHESAPQQFYKDLPFPTNRNYRPSGVE
jgi:hypothetical protein